MKIEISEHLRKAHPEVNECEIKEAIITPNEIYLDQMRGRLVHLRKRDDSWLCVILEKEKNAIYVVTAFYMPDTKKNKYITGKYS